MVPVTLSGALAGLASGEVSFEWMRLVSTPLAPIGWQQLSRLRGRSVGSAWPISMAVTSTAPPRRSPDNPRPAAAGSKKGSHGRLRDEDKAKLRATLMSVDSIQDDVRRKAAEARRVREENSGLFARTFKGVVLPVFDEMKAELHRAGVESLIARSEGKSDENVAPTISFSWGAKRRLPLPNSTPSKWTFSGNLQTGMFTSEA